MIVSARGHFLLRWIRDTSDLKTLPGTMFQSFTSSFSVGATARCGLWPVEQYFSIFPYLSPTLSIFSLPSLEDLSLLLLSILSWVFLFILSLPVLEWRSFWASYPSPFSPGDPANLSFAPLSILLYFLLYSKIPTYHSSQNAHTIGYWPLERSDNTSTSTVSRFTKRHTFWRFPSIARLLFL